MTEVQLPPTHVWLFGPNGFFRETEDERHRGANLSGPAGAVRDALYATRAEGAPCVVRRLSNDCEIKIFDAQHLGPALEGEVRLTHGQGFSIDGRRYRVYADPQHRQWSPAAAPLAPHSVQRISTIDLLRATKGFLYLPFVSPVWTTHFEQQTGFVQCRDGQIPAVTDVRAELRDEVVALACTITVWCLFREKWQASREQCEFTGLIGEADVDRLLASAALWPASER